MKLKNKKAFITGGSSGIGAAIATLFAKEGADISFCYFKDETKANLVMEKINGYGRKCFNQNIDIGKKDNCDDFFQKSLQSIGEPDILVNNAGIIYARPVSYTHLRAHETGRNLVLRLGL